MKSRVGALLLIISALLAACGGGGGGGPTPSAPPATLPPPAVASVSGKVVDDASGSALSGVNVGLAPWVADATPMPEGTTAPDGTFTFTAQPGHYLLVIGSNSPTDITRATVHDNVTLVAGVDALHAPTLGAIPNVTPPASETGGNYRLAMLNQTTEAPCITAYDQLRVARGLPQVVVDEWLIENARGWNANFQSPNFQPGVTSPGNGFGYLSTGNVSNRGYTTHAGETDCQANDVDAAFTGSAVAWSQSAHNLWFAGSFIGVPNNPGADSGIVEFPWDPRYQADPNASIWP